MRPFIVIFSLFAIGFKLFAQNASQPLELPNFIIEGKEQIDVQVGTKQMPVFPTYISRGLLDSLIIVEKPRNYIVFPVTFPTSKFSKKYPNGYTNLSLGSFFTGNLNFGYNTKFADYDIFTFGEIKSSKGHLENAAYTGIFLGAQSEYLAPDKFFIFGGSKTTTNIEFKNRNYKLYAIENPPSRTQTDFLAKISSTGNFESFDFNTGANFYIFHQSGAGNSLNETTLGGFLEIAKSSFSNQFGGSISIDFRSLNNNSANFFEASGFYRFEYEQNKIEPKIGLQLTRSSNGNSRPMILACLNIERILTPNLEISGGISNKLKNIALNIFAFENPYLSDSIYLDYTNFTEIYANLKFQPTKDLTAIIGTKFSLAKRYPVFWNISKEFFIIEYLDATFFQLFAEGYWIVPLVGDFSLCSSLNFSTLSTNKKEVPYVPVFKGRFDYRRKFFEKLNINIFGEFTGTRYADPNNQVLLDAYNNIGCNIEYLFSNSVFLSFKIENLLNSNVWIWNNYKERGLNLNIALTYKF